MILILLFLVDIISFKVNDVLVRVLPGHFEEQDLLFEGFHVLFVIEMH